MEVECDALIALEKLVLVSGRINKSAERMKLIYFINTI